MLSLPRNSASTSLGNNMSNLNHMDRTVTQYVNTKVLVARLVHLSATIRKLESYQSSSWADRALHDLYAELQRIRPQVEEYYTQMPTYQMEREFYAELVQIKIKAEEYLRRTKQEQ